MFQPRGIILCQFVESASDAIRSAKNTFDDVDLRLENVALTLGCTQWGAFRRIRFPLALHGVLAGGITLATYLSQAVFTNVKSLYSTQVKFAVLRNCKLSLTIELRSHE